MTTASTEKLDALESKILRRILGPVKEEEVWRARYNHELYQMYKEPKFSRHNKTAETWLSRTCATNEGRQDTKEDS